MLELNLISPARSRTRGAFTTTSPIPVWMVRSGNYPLRTTRCFPAASFSSRWLARNSFTSVLIAFSNNSCAPCRKTAVKASATGNAIPGFLYSTKLSSCTAYSSLAIRLMVRRKTHQEYATCFIPSYTTFDDNSPRPDEGANGNSTRSHYCEDKG